MQLRFFEITCIISARNTFIDVERRYVIGGDTCGWAHSDVSRKKKETQNIHAISVYSRYIYCRTNNTEDGGGGGPGGGGGMIHISISFHGIEVLSRTNGEIIPTTNRIHTQSGSEIVIYMCSLPPAPAFAFASCDIDTVRGQLNVFQHT